MNRSSLSHYKQIDRDRLIQVALKNSYILTSSEANDIWRSYSTEHYAAGWTDMAAYTDDQLWNNAIVPYGKVNIHRSIIKLQRLVDTVNNDNDISVTLNEVIEHLKNELVNDL